MKRLKILLMTITLVAINLAVVAQNGFGLRGGISLSAWEYISEDQDAVDAYNDMKDPLFGGQAFGFYHWEKNHFALQPELGWIQKGVVLGESDYKIRTNVNYLELPVLLMGVFGKSNKFTVFAGPSIAYGITGHWTYIENGEKNRESIDWNDDEFARTDISLHVGTSALIPLRTGRCNVDVRYIYGFTNLSTSDFGDSNDSFHNSCFAISLGYIWPSKSKEK